MLEFRRHILSYMPKPGANSWVERARNFIYPPTLAECVEVILVTDNINLTRVEAP